jgi:hypothetical protein
LHAASSRSGRTIEEDLGEQVGEEEVSDEDEPILDYAPTEDAPPSDILGKVMRISESVAFC